MLKITDMTLSCLEWFDPSADELTELYSQLLSLGVDFIEMPADVYDIIRPAPSNRVVLRISSQDEASGYPEIVRFICRRNGMVSGPSIVSEIQINDVKEINRLSQYGAPQNVRLVGLDDILCHDYLSAFSTIKKQIKGRIEFCPENSYCCATASAVEWAACDGTDIVTSFGGLSGKAPLEEVLLALRFAIRYKPGASFAAFPQISELMEQITSRRFSDRKAVIGRRIFEVESGIHVDGILKKPQMYEPFLPELVGNSRKFVIGKHSGRKSVAAKLRELGYSADDFALARLLSEIRDESVKKQSSLTDDEFERLALKFKT